MKDWLEQLPEGAQFWHRVKHNRRRGSKRRTIIYDRSKTKENMNTQTQDKSSYAGIAIPLTQTDIKKAARGNKPLEGWYRFTIATAKADVSKNGGSMMFVTEALITDGEGNTRGKPIRDYLVLPISTPTPLLEAAGFPASFTHTAPNTVRFVREYLQATRPAEFPYDLKFDEETRTWSYQGAEVSKKEAEVIKEEKSAAMLAFLTNAWADAQGTFGGDTFYGKLEDDSEGRPEITVMRAELPEGETLVVA